MSFREQLQQVPSPTGPDLPSMWVCLPVGQWRRAAPQDVGQESGLDSLGGVLSAHQMNCLHRHKKKWVQICKGKGKRLLLLNLLSTGDTGQF